MRLQSWLKSLVRKLNQVNVARGRASTRASHDGPTIIERLETRQMLSAVPMAAGVEALVNTGTTGDQYHSAVAMDAAGDYVVAWQSVTSRYDYGIYARRFNAAGTAQGAEIVVSTISRYDSFPSVAMDDQGDFVVEWNSVNFVYAQRYNAAGSVSGSRLQVNSNSTPTIPSASVAMDGAGDFVVSWVTYGTSPNDGVWAQRYNSSGAAQGSNFLVAGVTDPFSTGLMPPITTAVAIDATGDFVVAYSNARSQSNVFVSRYNAAGVLQGTAQVNSSTSSNQQARSVAMDAAGDFVVTWQSYVSNGGNQNGIYAQRYNAAGVAQGSNFQVYQAGTFQGYSPSSSIAAILEAPVRMDSVGNFAIAWTNEPDGSGPGIFMQAYNAAGVTQVGPVRVNTYTTGIQSSPGVGMDAAGDFVVVWNSEGQAEAPARWDVYAQQYSTATTPLLLQIEGTPLSAIGPLSTSVTSAIQVFDRDHANWTGATVAITQNYQNSQDVLDFMNTATITGSWNATTGILTLTGTDTIANYRAALRSVIYHNTSVSPNTALTRSVSFQTTNGTASSNVVTRALTVRADSTAPTLTGVPASGYFSQGTAPLSIAPNLVATEPDGLNLSSATVSFTGWQVGDRLAFLNNFALQHTFTEDLNAHTATLTITGNDTAAHYQATLRTVTFANVAGQPNTAAIRVATITINDPLHSATATENLTVVKYLSGLSPSVNFLQGSAPLAIAPNLVVTPPAGVNVTSATVSFTNWQGEDRVAFYNSLALQHSFTQDLIAHTATLTITGSATGANYQTLLRSVTYQDVAGKPNTSAIRVATFTVNDGTNTVSASENVTVTSANAPPLVQVNDSAPLTYGANSPAIAIMNKALVSDPDSNNLATLTVQITSGYQNNSNGHDVLSFVNQSGITGSFNATTGTLTLSGLSYVGNYRETLRLVKFNTTGSTVSLATRTFTVIVTDDGGGTSNPVTRNVTVTP